MAAGIIAESAPMSIIFLTKTLLFLLLAGILPGLWPTCRLTRSLPGVNFADRLILAAVIAPFVMVLVSFLEDLAGLPQSALVLALTAAALSAANLDASARLGLLPGWRELLPNMRSSRLAVYALFAVLMAARMVPSVGELTPFLHDPVSHAEWLKILHTTGHVTGDQWYPQGLEYFLNYAVTFTGLDYPKAVLVFSLYFVALFPVAMFYAGLMIARGGRRGTLLGTAFLLVAAAVEMPTFLHLEAGKNSMVMAFAVTPLILYLCCFARGRLDHMLTALFVAATVIVHYPTGLFLAIIYLVVNLGRALPLRQRRLRVDRQQLQSWLVGLGTVAALGAVIAMHAYFISRDNPAFPDQSISAVKSYLDSLGLGGYLRWDLPETEASMFTGWMLVAFLVSWGSLVAAGFFPHWREEDAWRFSAILVGAWLALFITSWLLLLPWARESGIYFYFEVRFFLLFPLVATLGWMLWLLIDEGLGRYGERLAYTLGMVLMSVLFVLNAAQDYTAYKDRQDELRTTSEVDREAFGFINSLPDDGLRIMIQQAMSGDIVIGSDSGVWIPSYTDRQVFVDFVHFSDPISYSVYDRYLAMSEDPASGVPVRNLYCRFGIGYIFSGADPLFADYLPREKLDRSPYLEKIFDNGAAVYRLLPWGCHAAGDEPVVEGVPPGGGRHGCYPVTPASSSRTHVGSPEISWRAASSSAGRRPAAASERRR